MISKKEFEYTVGRNLAKYRKEKKLTQMQVAEMAELSVPFYASVELGNKGLSAYSLYKLSAALGVDINCLLSDDILDERAKNIEALLSGKTERVKLAAEKLVGLLVESIWQKRRIVNSTKPTIRRLNFCDIYFLKISVHVCISVAQQENTVAILPKIWKRPCSSLGEQGLSSMEKQKNFPGLLCPESLEDTAFDAMSSKLADNDGGATQT